MKMIPGIDPAIFDYLKEHYDAVVLESFGVGGVPYYGDHAFEAEIQQVDAGEKSPGPSPPRWRMRVVIWRSMQWGRPSSKNCP